MLMRNYTTDSYDSNSLNDFTKSGISYVHILSYNSPNDNIICFEEDFQE